ncbi:hypothetical protein TRFO_15078 [Tritrichomonas foetus]|uniref:Uncharacterized protein n=1 Tax=Tritrichomonas foetus TaxID=1144522 RepID=A0A1J4KXW7_9EUKA|nr:hypothetical protein TRFO_15078 [Tritrichomonas foetus]|eukprot:OHT14540.1 hypothetical protein TRFO_15078 [Tritrichomonas foetus]
MKRVIQQPCDCFTIVDDNGTLAVSNKRTCQLFDVDSNVKKKFDLDRPIALLSGDPYLTISTEGAAYVLDPRNKLIGYLFPDDYASISASCVSFSASTTLMAVGVSDIVLVYDLNKPLEKSLIALLQGHEAPIVKCTFLTYTGYEHLIISCSEDQRFIVWDLNKRVMVYESPYESSYSIKGISSFDTNHFFAIAFEDGFVRLYDASPILADKPSVRFVKMINVTKAEFDMEDEEEEPSIIISKTKPPKPQPKPDMSGEAPPLIIAAGSAALYGREYMLVATANSVISLNVATFERSLVHTFDEEAAEVCFNTLIVASKSSFSTNIYIKRLSIGVMPEVGLQLFPESEPPVNSPLNSEIALKTKQATPIATLHKTVKSSGYAKKPQASRFTKKTAAATKKTTKKTTTAASETILTNVKIPKTITKSYNPLEAPLSNAALSADGKRLICADNAGTIVFVKAKSTPAYLGHKQPITGLSWNTTHGFISASLDRTVKFWDIDRPDPLLTMSKPKGESSKGPTFQDDITGASYFWQDKFVLLAYGQTLSLYGYHLPSLNANAKTVADMHQTGTYKPVKSIHIENNNSNNGANQQAAGNTSSYGKIIAMAASNAPMSPIALVATTAKTIHAVDFYSGNRVLDLETKHDRPVFSICANYGGIFTPRDSSETPDMCLTGALDETFKLWDLRSARCERTMVCGSRTVRVGSCFSPDSHFVALGTERQGIEIWDIGQGTCVTKLKDDLRGQTVTYLQWNPSTGKLTCGTEAGVIKIFS